MFLSIWDANDLLGEALHQGEYPNMQVVETNLVPGDRIRVEIEYERLRVLIPSGRYYFTCQVVRPDHTVLFLCTTGRA